MLVAIHKNSHDGLDKYTQVFETVLAHNGIDTVRLDVNELDFWEEVRQLE